MKIKDNTKEQSIYNQRNMTTVLYNSFL